MIWPVVSFAFSSPAIFTIDPRRRVIDDDIAREQAPERVGVLGGEVDRAVQDAMQQRRGEFDGADLRRFRTRRLFRRELVGFGGLVEAGVADLGLRAGLRGRSRRTG